MAAPPEALIFSLAVGTDSCMSRGGLGRYGLLEGGGALLLGGTVPPSSREECEEVRDMGSVAGDSLSAAKDASKLSMRLKSKAVTISLPIAKCKYRLHTKGEVCNQLVL